MAKFKTYYMDEAVFRLPEVIETARERLARVDFDTIVGTGFSGSIVIPALALALGKNFVLIRKESDDSHHGGGNLVGQLGARWIFVDDFTATGRTRDRVIRKIRDTGYPTEMVGQYMYVNWNEEGPVFQPFEEEWVSGGPKAGEAASSTCDYWARKVARGEI